MSQFKFARLSDRGIVALKGEDAAKLLNGLITNDMARLDTAPALHAGLLTPQGKILFDFFVVKAPGGYLLDTARGKTGELAKRLTMYKLRSKVEIADASEAYAVFAVWPQAGTSPGPQAEGIVYPDPRLPALGWRLIAPAQATAIGHGATEAAESDYHSFRMSLGVPEGGKDYEFGDAFPHEALFDQLHGVSFTKGCYVGQEIVSRMEHRGTARKRIVPIAGERALEAGASIKLGEAPIGVVGSVSGNHGLALIRLDRVGEAAAKGLEIEAGGTPITVTLPTFASFSIPAPGTTYAHP